MRDAGPAILDQYIESENQHRTPAPQSKRKESTAGQRLFSTPFALLVHIPSDLLSLSLFRSLARSAPADPPPIMMSNSHNPFYFLFFPPPFVRSLARSLLPWYNFLFFLPIPVNWSCCWSDVLCALLFFSPKLCRTKRESDLCIGRGRRH